MSKHLRQSFALVSLLTESATKIGRFFIWYRPVDQTYLRGAPDTAEGCWESPEFAFDMSSRNTTKISKNTLRQRNRISPSVFFSYKTARLGRTLDMNISGYAKSVAVC
jgi:hypothetical protein